MKMPVLTAWAIRLALIYLLLGFTFGGLLLWHKGTPLHPAMWSLLPAHIEFLLVGWTAQLILAMAFWILPRYRGGSRGPAWLAWLAFAALNLGILLVALAGSLRWPPVFTFAGRLAEALAALLFAAYNWGRVMPTGHNSKPG